MSAPGHGFAGLLGLEPATAGASGSKEKATIGIGKSHGDRYPFSIRNSAVIQREKRSLQLANPMTIEFSFHCDIQQWFKGERNRCNGRTS